MAVLQKFNSFNHFSSQPSQFKKPKLCFPLKIQIFSCPIKHRIHHPSFQVPSSLINTSYSDQYPYAYTQKLVQEFDPKIPIEEAGTPPSSWYTDPSFYNHELNQVFFKGWQAVGYTEQIKEPSQYFTGRLGNVEYVVCRDDGGKIHAFHNVCRHHASLLASGSGKRSCFVCPYHVFCDNYLDGGYHVPYAHKGLASGLTLGSYSTTILEKVSIQRCETGSAEKGQEYDRLGSKALYAFVYPNFMINRYGPWMDTNLVLPQGPRKCLVIFDYFLDASLKGDDSFIAQSLQDSEIVQMEDIKLCEAVQRGLESPAYNSGRYAPQVEKAMHHFHCLLYENLCN